MSNEKSISQNFREIAEELKSNKAKIADSFVKGVSDARTVLKETSETLKDVSDAVRGYAEIYASSSEIVNEFLSNEKYTRSAKSVVENLVSDVANRINEVGNVVEEVSKDEKIKNLMETAVAAGVMVRRAFERISKRHVERGPSIKFSRDGGKTWTTVRHPDEKGTDPKDRTGANIS